MKLSFGRRKNPTQSSVDGLSRSQETFTHSPDLFRRSGYTETFMLLSGYIYKHTTTCVNIVSGRAFIPAQKKQAETRDAGLAKKSVQL